MFCTAKAEVSAYVIAIAKCQRRQIIFGLFKLEQNMKKKDFIPAKKLSSGLRIIEERKERSNRHSHLNPFVNLSHFLNWEKFNIWRFDVLRAYKQYLQKILVTDSHSSRNNVKISKCECYVSVNLVLKNSTHHSCVVPIDLFLSVHFLKIPVVHPHVSTDANPSQKKPSFLFIREIIFPYYW